MSGPTDKPLNALPVTKTYGTKLLLRICLTAIMPLASPSLAASAPTVPSSRPHRCRRSEAALVQSLSASAL